MADLTLDDAILAVCRERGLRPDDTAPADFPDPIQDPRFPGATIARIAAYRDHPEIQERATALLQQFRELEELTLIRNAKMRRAMGRD